MASSSSVSEDTISPVRKHPKRFSWLVDEKDEEDVSDKDVDIEGNDTNDQSAVKWVWKNVENKPKIWRYTAVPGVRPTVLHKFGTYPRKLNVFYEIFNHKFWDILATETNQYADQVIGNERQRGLIDDNWVPINSDEMKAFYAMCIIMTHVRRSSIRMFWSNRSVIDTSIFRRIMPYAKFLQISTFLHFTKDTVHNTDTVHKLEPIINLWNGMFEEIYTPNENLSVDESAIKFIGNRSYVQYQPLDKSNLSWMKMYKLCESDTRFCLRFKIDTKQSNKAEKISEDTFTNIITELTQSVINNGHTLFLDMWCFSPKLFLALLRQKTNIIGIAHRHKRNMPEDLINKVLQKGRYEIRSCHGILVLKWKSKQSVYVISTKHKNVKMLQRKRGEFKKYRKPDCFIEFTKNMERTDHQDQLLVPFCDIQKSMRTYQKLFFYISDIALFNTYVLYNKITGEDKLHYIDYRIALAEALLQDVQLPDYGKRL